MSIMQTSSQFDPKSIEDFRAQFAAQGGPAFARALFARAQSLAGFNAFIGLDEAAFASAYAGAPAQGPLSGIPFAVKDNIDAVPFTTTGGCPAMRDYRPTADAPPVARLKAAGARVIGKTNLHELAFGISSNNAHFGAVGNPFDPKRIAGGSSGGSAAAVALGIVPFALGSDTGGSVRVPAAICGVVGFRPTTGRYPAGGVLTLSPTRDTIGVIASTVADTALVDGIIAGTTEMPDLPQHPLRIGVLANARPGLAKAVDAAINTALDRLAAKGIELVPVDSASFDDVEQMGMPVAICETFAFWTEFTQKRLGKSLAEFAAGIGSPDVRGLFENLEATADSMRPAFEAALSGGRAELQRRYAALFVDQKLDAIVTSTVPVQPPFIGDDAEFTSDGKQYPTFMTVIRNTSLASIVGAPSLSVPAGYDRDGLPVGLQVECPAGDDRRVLALGRQFETLLTR
jgi:Asp-tRNA(Asn)/Glu-tRNA(Gln) amidotransferase A subunit family amidase